MNTILQLIAEYLSTMNPKTASGLNGKGQPVRIERVDLIKQHEGLRLKAYLPTKKDVWTIGYGHTKTAVEGMVITQEQADKLFRDDLAWVRKAIAKNVTVPLSQPQYDALASFIYNLGETNLARSTLLRKLNASDYVGAANEFPKWNKQKGKVLRGLVKRRAAERNLFLKGTKR